MSFLDYAIIAIVAALFVLALIVYRKKPHCSCGSTECSGDCSCCSSKCSKNQSHEKITCSGK